MSSRFDLAAIRERQQAAAKAWAEGASLRDVAALLGVPIAVAARLLERPAMRELVQSYRPAA